MTIDSKQDSCKLEVCSCSWIDPENMVDVLDSSISIMDGLIAIFGTSFTSRRSRKQKKALTKEQEHALEDIDRTAYWLSKGRNVAWTKLAAISLAMTDNTNPPEQLEKEKPDQSWANPASRHYREYRALVTWCWERGQYQGGHLDPGWTPPAFDTLRANERYSKRLGANGFNTLSLNLNLGLLPAAIVAHLSKYWPGEKSSCVSSIETGKLHPNSYLRKHLPKCQILLNAIIKFRAGTSTNMVGTLLMGSPYHVPWVWCEHALVKEGSRYKLYIAGSNFPSHTLYINGNKMGTLRGVKLTGTPLDSPLLRGAKVEDLDFIAPADQSDKMADAPRPIDEHPYTVKPNETRYLSFDVTKWIEEKEEEKGTTNPEENSAVIAKEVTQEEQAGLASSSSASLKGRIRSKGKLAVTDPPTIVTEPNSGATWDGKGAIQIVEKSTGRISIQGNDVLCGSLGFIVAGCLDSAGGTCFGQGVIRTPAERKTRGEDKGVLLADDEGTCKGTIMRNTGPPGNCECKVRLEAGD